MFYACEALTRCASFRCTSDLVLIRLPEMANQSYQQHAASSVLADSDVGHEFSSGILKHMKDSGLAEA